MPTPSQSPAPFPSPPRSTRCAGLAPLVASLAALAAVACDRPEEPARPATPPAAVAPAPVESAPPPPAPTSTWNGDAGLALVVPGPAGEALLVVPGTGTGEVPADTAAGAATAALPGEVVLYARGGRVGRTRATAVAAAPGADGAGCRRWPTVRLGAGGGTDLPSWTLGLVAPAGATPPAALPLDSLEALGTADSALVAAAVTRLASTLPAVQGEDAARFRALPFVVKSARRFAADSGTEGIVAVLGRTLPQEASPLSEEVLLVAERTAGAAAGAAGGSQAPWTVAYSERASGREEAVATVDVLGALAIGRPPRAALVLSREADRGSRYVLLERAAPGTWKVRWRSVYRGC